MRGLLPRLAGGRGNGLTLPAALLSDFSLHIVGVLAPLDVLEARERQRGDRPIGLRDGDMIASTGMSATTWKSTPARQRRWSARCGQGTGSAFSPLSSKQQMKSPEIHGISGRTS